MGRKKLYSDEENRERAKARATRYNRAKTHRTQVGRFREEIDYIRRHDFTPVEELAEDLTKKWRLLEQYEHLNIDK